MAEIRLQGLAHSYHPDPQRLEDYALQAIDHTWQQGGAYALLGPSGCGKSTLLNIISGLLAPSQGEVLFDGNRVNELTPQQRNIAQVFQFPVVYDAMTVAQNLAFPLKNMGLDKASIQNKVAEIAELLELTASLDKKANNLSADEKQKVSMARGLVREDVSAILFDEPLTVIDPNLKWKLRRKLKQIHEQLNITMLYVTHDQLEAATFADEIALMYQGRIVQFGTPQALFERPNHTFVGYFIGSPGMNFLPVSKSAEGAKFGDINLPLTATQMQALTAAKGDNLKVGIRPEYIQVTGDPEQATLTGKLAGCEHLGNYQLLSVTAADQLLHVRVDEHWQADGESIYLHFPAQWLKLYIDEYLAGEA